MDSLYTHLNENIIYKNDNTSSSSEEREQFIGIKVGLIVGIFAMTLLASYVPFILGRSKVKNLVTILSFLTCFAAGIILAGAFNHLLPDANENFMKYFERVSPNNQFGEFPYGPTIAIFVLFLLIALDKLVVERGVAGEAGHNHMNLSASISSFTPDGDTPHHHHGHNSKNTETTILIEETNGGVTLSTYQGLDNHSHRHHYEDINNGKSHQANVSQAWIFMLALSVHSIFDGLGLGAETDPNDFYGLLVAVLAHKALDGFALGVPVFYAKFSPLQTAISLSFCAAMTPLGIGIGMGLSSYFSGDGSILTEAIVLSITTGSFLYISLIELLPSGLNEPGWLKVKLFLTFLGWVLLALLALWV